MSTYKLEQAGKVFLFTTSIVGDNIRLACKNVSSPKNKKCSRDFSIEKLHKLDKLFNVLKTPIQAIQYIDEALRQQKVGVTEENNLIKITFYITTKGITNQIDIPLGDSNSEEISTNGQEYIQQTEHIENYETTNIVQDINNYDQYLQNIDYTQDNQITSNEKVDYNQYTTTQVEGNVNIYTTNETTQNDTGFDMNKYLSEIKTNVEGGPYISPADNEDINQYYKNYQTVENSNTTTNINEYNTDYNQLINQVETKQSESTNINFDEQLKQILQQDITNITDTNNIITTHVEEKEINKESKPLTTTKVLPVKTTTRVLPPIGPFTSLEGLDLHKLGIMNSEHQKIPPFEQVFNTSIPTPQTDTKTEYFEVNELINSQNQVPQVVTTGKTKVTKTTITTTNQNNNYNFNTDAFITDNLSNLNNINSINNINSVNQAITEKQVTNTDSQLINSIKTENITLKKQIAELRKSQSELQKITVTKTQLAELDSLRKKVAEYEILKGQLKELNTLRVQAAEFNSAKIQLKELNTLKEKIREQNKEIAELRLKAAEADKLKKKVEELENIKIRYEKDIKGLQESLRIYSIKTITKEEKDEKEEKEPIEEETPEEVTVKGDIIHDINELELITKKINRNNQKLTLNLLYKATADTDKAEAFHAKCDDAKSSIVLIETDKGKRFGGYTSLSWKGDCEDKKDEEAFVFSLDKMKTYDNIPGEDAIGCYPKFGPIFLGCQIRIYDNAFTKGGTTFERGLNFDTLEDFELNDGERTYNVKEIEVYEVIFE